MLSLLSVAVPLALYLTPIKLLRYYANKNDLPPVEYINLYFLLPLYAPVALYQDIKIEKRGLNKIK